MVYINAILKKRRICKGRIYLQKESVWEHRQNCYYHPFTIPTESKLISMGDNVVLAKGVELITHDMSYALLGHDEKLSEDIGDRKYPYYKKVSRSETMLRSAQTA